MRLRILIAVTVFIVLAAGTGTVLLYSGSWPPVYTVESESMEHSSSWTAGTINVGDIVMVKNIHSDASSVVTYVQGRTSGYSTYGEYGNVILYNAPTGEVIIHRAMFYLTWSGGHPVVSGDTGQSWLTVGNTYVVIHNASYTGRNLIVYLNNLVNKSGFITVGDFNLAHSALYNRTADAYAAADQNVFGYNPVSPGGVVGVAFWQVPWFGLIKLNLMRVSGSWTQYNEVPNNSYLFLGLALAAIVILVLFPYGRVMEKRKKP